jgi:FkbM family methyltransferase
MIHSQSDEEPVILEFFKDKNDGVVLDIGAYHYATFSNSRALINKGWYGVLVEPSPRCFSTLMRFYDGNNKIKLVNAFISDRFSLTEFFDSEGAVATNDVVHFERWSALQNDYQSIFIPTIPATELLYVIQKADFITIDCEGADYSILKALPLERLKPRLLCIEYAKHGQEIFDHMMALGFQLHHKNNENLFFQKEYL